MSTGRTAWRAPCCLRCGARKSGYIIPISSQLGRVIAPFSGHYSPTKFALEAMNEAMAYELVPHGIDVTIVQPGGYPTDVWRNRNIYTGALKARAEQEHLAGYPQVVARMGEEDGSGRSADPMDVPRAIARLIAMPAGTPPAARAGASRSQAADSRSTRCRRGCSRNGWANRRRSDR